MPAACRYVAMPRRSGLEAAACFPSNQAAAISALRADGSSSEGKTVEPCAIKENTPERQTAVIKKKCNENGVVREPLVCEKRWRDPRRVNFLKEKSLRKFVLFPKLRSALPVEE